jgi:hypothetical protein
LTPHGAVVDTQEKKIAVIEGAAVLAAKGRRKIQ